MPNTAPLILLNFRFAFSFRCLGLGLGRFRRLFAERTPTSQLFPVYSAVFRLASFNSKVVLGVAEHSIVYRIPKGRSAAACPEGDAFEFGHAFVENLIVSKLTA